MQATPSDEIIIDTTPSLIEGEEIKFDEGDEEPPSGGSDEMISQKYEQGVMRIITEQARVSVKAIPGLILTDYKIDPSYQRRHRWDNNKRSKLIESLIINVPVPPIFLYEIEYSKYEVMDGLQRLSAIADFYNNQYALSGLSEWSELNGRTYSTLPYTVRTGIDRRYLSSIVLLYETAKDPDRARRLKEMVFERINSGGVQLAPQESRNALYAGPFNDLCVELSANQQFRAMWDLSTDGRTLPHEPVEQLTLNFPIRYNQKIAIRNDMYQQMGDVELVLRFFAFRQWNKHTRDRIPTIKKFLDEYLRKANKFSPATIEGLKKMFMDCIDLAYKIFGMTAFHLQSPHPISFSNRATYSRPTKVVYDALMHALCQHLPSKQALIEQKKNVNQQVREMYKLNPQAFQGRSTNHSDTERRQQLFFDAINKALRYAPPSGAREK